MDRWGGEAGRGRGRGPPGPGLAPSRWGPPGPDRHQQPDRWGGPVAAEAGRRDKWDKWTAAEGELDCLCNHVSRQFSGHVCQRLPTCLYASKALLSQNPWASFTPKC